MAIFTAWITEVVMPPQKEEMGVMYMRPDSVAEWLCSKAVD